MVAYASRSLLPIFRWDHEQGMLLDEVGETSLVRNARHNHLFQAQAQQQTVRRQLDPVDRVCEIPWINNHRLLRRRRLVTQAEFTLTGSRSCSNNSL